MRRSYLLMLILAAYAAAPASADQPTAQVTKYAHFRVGERVAWGIVEGDHVREISRDPFGPYERTDRVHPLNAVKLLIPTRRKVKVFAVAGNYVSHLAGEREPAKHPEIFYKLPTCLIPTGAAIVIPPGTKEVHFEAELVIVIKKRAKNISPQQARDYILGVTCGNDISARDWQENDIQWWRAKGSDTFGPIGPFVVSGLDYTNLTLQLRHNGVVKQKENTKNMVHNVYEIVSWISRHVTLEPGDVIFTGTPGTTAAIKPGDVLEVELEGVGVLKNRVVRRGKRAAAKPPARRGAPGK